MKLLVTADTILYKTQDGKYWCKTIYEYKFWERYLDVFENVVIVARTAEATNNQVENYLRTDGPNVSVRELPNMRGMKQYILNYFSFRNSAKKAIEGVDCALIRLPSITADMVLKFFKKTGKPYALEIVADPFDAYVSNKVAQNLYSRRLMRAVKEANGVSYVTEKYLQEKYPSNARLNGSTKFKFEDHYSTIDLPEDYFTSPKSYKEEKRAFTIIHTANSINNDLKGHDTVIKVLKNLRNANYNVNVIFIGDGTKREYYEEMTKKLQLNEFVTFTGILSSASEVRKILLQGDLFLFPSKAEGLPRAVIEAMAVGLPCLSTTVNGIPELLNEKYLFCPDDVEGFTIMLAKLIDNPKELEVMSENNIRIAKKYSRNNLSIRRRNFYSKLRSISEQ